MTELSDVENACLEAAQEDPSHMVCAAEVVRYVHHLLREADVSTISRAVTEAQVSRTLRKLHDAGVLKREPRGSLGWGRGWEPSFYKLRDARGVR